MATAPAAAAQGAGGSPPAATPKNRSIAASRWSPPHAEMQHRNGRRLRLSPKPLRYQYFLHFSLPTQPTNQPTNQPTSPS